MWCKRCQQDMPGITAGEDAKLRCMRCSTPLGIDAESPTADQGDPVVSTGKPVAIDGDNAEIPPIGDGWELGEKLRHIQRVVQPGKATATIPSKTGPADFRIDGPHAGPPQWHAPVRRKKPAGRRKRPVQVKQEAAGEGTAGLSVWIAVSLGVMLLVCGGILLVWSMVAGRPELWNIGLPMAVVGQVALVVGLVLQLDRLWHHNRHTAAKLDNVDEQLHDLRSAAAMLTTSHSSPATAFYSHFTNGASPQMLLADLKGQLDLLAGKLK